MCKTNAVGSDQAVEPQRHPERLLSVLGRPAPPSCGRSPGRRSDACLGLRNPQRLGSLPQCSNREGTRRPFEAWQVWLGTAAPAGKAFHYLVSWAGGPSCAHSLFQRFQSRSEELGGLGQQHRCPAHLGKLCLGSSFCTLCFRFLRSST